jgi:hypothetical protein
MPRLAPCAYAVTNYGHTIDVETICPSCFADRFPHVSLLPSEWSETEGELFGEVYRHDLDLTDKCPCDMCGTSCAKRGK